VSDEQDLKETAGIESANIELFESGERTNYKQGVHTMDAAKIAEGSYPYVFLVLFDVIQVTIL
jgi:hypothetical protein